MAIYPGNKWSTVVVQKTLGWTWSYLANAESWLVVQAPGWLARKTNMRVGGNGGQARLNQWALLGAWPSTRLTWCGLIWATDVKEERGTRSLGKGWGGLGESNSVAMICEDQAARTGSSCKSAGPDSNMTWPLWPSQQSQSLIPICHSLSLSLFVSHRCLWYHIPHMNRFPVIHHKGDSQCDLSSAWCSSWLVAKVMSITFIHMGDKTGTNDIRRNVNRLQPHWKLTLHYCGEVREATLGINNAKHVYKQCKTTP